MLETEMATRHERIQSSRRTGWLVTHCVDCGSRLPEPRDSRLTQWHLLCEDCRDLREDVQARMGRMP